MPETFLISGLLTLLVMLLMYCRTLNRDISRYRAEWRKWEKEYWLLRESDAIRSDYSIRLSWLPYGENECIKKDIGGFCEHGRSMNDYCEPCGRVNND